MSVPATPERNAIHGTDLVDVSPFSTGDNDWVAPSGVAGSSSLSSIAPAGSQEKKGSEPTKGICSQVYEMVSGVFAWIRDIFSSFLSILTSPFRGKTSVVIPIKSELEKLTPKQLHDFQKAFERLKETFSIPSKGFTKRWKSGCNRLSEESKKLLVAGRIYYQAKLLEGKDATKEDILSLYKDDLKNMHSAFVFELKDMHSSDGKKQREDIPKILDLVIDALKEASSAENGN